MIAGKYSTNGFENTGRGMRRMTYACETCGFLFRRFGPIDCCPSCGSNQLHPADAAEEKQLEDKLMKEHQDGGKS